jgi:hypothetical protein
MVVTVAVVVAGLLYGVFMVLFCNGFVLIIRLSLFCSKAMKGVR